MKLQSKRSAGGSKPTVFCLHQAADFWNAPFVASGRTTLPEDFADHGAADPVGFGDLGQAHSTIPVPHDSGSIYMQWTAPSLTAFEAGAPHSGTHPFDDQVPLQLGDGADDDDDGP